MCQLCAAAGSPIPGLHAEEPFGTAGASKAAFTLPQIVTQLQTQWGGSGEGTPYTRPAPGDAITYSIPTSAYTGFRGEGAGFIAPSATMLAQGRLAFELWDDVIAVSLNEVPGANAGIVLGRSSVTSGGGTYAYYASTPGQIWLNAGWSTNNDTGFQVGGYGLQTMIHEIGHTLGLSHPGTYDASRGSVSYETGAEYAQDTRRHTVMSYFQADADGSGTVHRANGVGAVLYGATPLLHDIAAVQAKYGEDWTTRTGDTTYGFNASADLAGRPVFDFGRNANPIVAIWDAGGTDTLDLSGFSSATVLDLAPGAFSSAAGMTNNIAIAFGAQIENGVGGGGADRIAGNALGNYLRGQGGNDTLLGLDGDDALQGGTGDDRLDGGAGADTLDGGAGNDALRGGGGTDTYRTLVAGLTVTVRDALLGDYLFQGAEGSDAVSGVERVEAPGYALNATARTDGFDAFLYLVRNADVRLSGLDARVHFDATGWREGRDPNGAFDTDAYLAANRDVRAAGINPLDHYVLYGAAEGRDPGVLFDGAAYLGRNADVRAAGLNPLVHFLATGREEGRVASAAIGPDAGRNGFDRGWYLLAYTDVAAAGLDAESHYRQFGWQEGRGAGAFVDGAGYLRRYADAAAARVDPLTHYLTVGWQQGRDPSAAFDTSRYLDANPDVRAAGLNPLLHYLSYGAAEGRLAIGDGLFD